MTSEILSERRKKVLITGGTGSVGKSLVAEFASSGYQVSFQYHSAANIAEELASLHQAVSYQIDLSKPFNLPDQSIDILINNAGVNITDALTEDTSFEDFMTTLKINLVAAFLTTKQCLRWMTSQHYGRIINISSIYALRAVEGNLSYTVSKHGLSGLTRTVAKEYARYGITCNEISPGPIESRLMTVVASRVSDQEGGTAEEYLEELRGEIPARRLCYPKEIAKVAAFLASPDSQYINGVTIPIDGAWIV